MAPTRLHPIQAVDIRVEGAHAERRARRPNEAPLTTATTSLPRARLVDFGEDGGSFSIEVRVRVRVPLVDEAVWVASLRLVASFVSAVEIRRVDAQEFARMSGMFLVWPYARTYLTELAQLAGVTAPLLPLLTRPGQVVVVPATERE